MDLPEYLQRLSVVAGRAEIPLARIQEALRDSRAVLEEVRERQAAPAPTGGEGTREDLLAGVDLLLACLDEVASWDDRPSRVAARRVARMARRAGDHLRHAEHEAAEILEHVA